MYLKMYKKYGAVLSSLFLAAQSINAQTDSLFLTIDQLFERGVQHSLQLQADVMKESMAQERIRTARSAQLPELQIGLKGGFVGQPVVWERGLSDPSYPEAPDWSQNYAIDLAQPLYQGGKIRSAIHKADIEKQVAELQTLTDEAEIKLRLLNQYMNLFSLFKQHEILTRNIEESELRLRDIRRMKKEGLITNNDVWRKRKIALRLYRSNSISCWGRMRTCYYNRIQPFSIRQLLCSPMMTILFRRMKMIRR